MPRLLHFNHRQFCKASLKLCAFIISCVSVATLLASESNSQEVGSKPDASSMVTIELQESADEIKVPADVSEVIAAYQINQVSGEQTPARIRVSKDGQETTIVRSDAQELDASRPLLLETVVESNRFSDGRMMLLAEQAQLSGDTFKLESNGNNHRVGFWTDASDYVHWKFKATRWGMYDLRLTYSLSGSESNEVKVSLGDKTNEATINPTGDWYLYQTVSLGQVYLAEAGDKVLTLKPTSLNGAAVMNLKAITLVPACEGEMPVQDVDSGVVTLHGKDSIVRGTNLRYEPIEKKRTLGFWTNQTDAAEWVFELTTPGDYVVQVLQGCGKGQGGSKVIVSIHDQALSFTVQDTGHFQNFVPVEIGSLQFPNKGKYLLRVQPDEIAGVAACDIRQIRLLPKKREQ